MKKSIALASVTLFLFTYQTVFAVWYNPLTWFSKSKSVEQIQLDQSITNQVTSSSFSENATETPTTQPQTIVKTITVDNPELQKEVNELSQKLADESAQLTQATTEYNNLLAEYNKTVQSDAVFDSSIQTMVTDILAQCKKPPVYIPQPSVSSYQPAPSFSCTTDTVLGTTYTYCR